MTTINKLGNKQNITGMQEVDAIKSQENIELIKRLLVKHSKGKLLYSDIWAIGINLALRISDLLSLTYEQIKHNDFKIKEGKTSKPRSLHIDKGTRAIIDRRRKENPTHVFLFENDSRRSKGKPVTRGAVSAKFKEVGDMLEHLTGERIKLSTHSMRKTKGYHLVQVQNYPLWMASELLNHDSEKVTRRYIGITSNDIKDLYSDDNSL